MMSAYSTRWRRRGMTLVELLIVVTIMTILLSLAVAMVRPAFRDRNIREAARQVNTFLTGARARAQAVGRPVGVWIERVDTTENGSRAAFQMFQAEVAAPFSGALTGARATIEPVAATLSSPPHPALFAGVQLGRLHTWTETGTVSTIDQIVLANLVEIGEVFSVKFNYMGTPYPGIRMVDNFLGDAGPVFLIRIPNGIPPGTTHVPPPVPPATAPLGTGVPFEVSRGPQRVTTQPLTLPGDAVIDLAVSGLGTDGNQFNPLVPAAKTPVIITFTPTGGVDYVFVDNASFRPFGAVHLLIGRRSQVLDPAIVNFADPTLEANLTDPALYWVSIGHRTGRIVTTNNTENRGLPAATTVPARIKVARDLARSSFRMGGR